MSSPHSILAHSPSTPDDLPGDQALAGLWSLYYRRGYEDGQRQVLRDLLGALVTMSEEFLRGKGVGAASEEPRKLIYAFENHLERQFEAMARDAAFVEGGLGI